MGAREIKVPTLMCACMANFEVCGRVAQEGVGIICSGMTRTFVCLYVNLHFGYLVLIVTGVTCINVCGNFMRMWVMCELIFLCAYVWGEGGNTYKVN